MAGSGIMSTGLVTLGSIELYQTHNLFPSKPSVYFSCQGENRTILPDVKKANILYHFKGEESWQPLTELPVKKCKQCGLYEEDTIKSDDVFDEWELCPDEFVDGKYSHFKDKEFNATFICLECTASADSTQTASSDSKAVVKKPNVTPVAAILAAAVTVIGLVTAYKLWQKRKREQDQARFLKLFEEGDDTEDELDIGHPLTELPVKKCKRCGLYEEDTIKSDDVFDEFEVCPDDFVDGKYSHFKDKEFNATFICLECTASADSTQTASSDSKAVVKKPNVTPVAVILAAAVTVIGLVTAYKLWQKRKREQDKAQFLKLFEEGDDIEDELDIGHTLTKLPVKKCKQCGLYEEDTIKSADVFDEWELCPNDFVDGKYSHFKDKEFNATFICLECTASADSTQTANSDSKAVVKKLKVALVAIICILAAAVTVIIGMVTAYKLWQKTKSFEEGDDIEDELVIGHAI